MMIPPIPAVATPTVAASPGTARPATPGPAQADPARLRNAAQDFEAMTIGALIAPMFETVDLSHGPFGGGAGEAAWKPVLIDHMARRIAASGGFGLTRSIEAALLRMQETRT